MPRGRGGGAFRAAKAEAQAEASQALIRSIIPYTEAGAASIETTPAIWYDSIISNVCSSYSHSFTLVCCGAIPIGSSSVVGFVHLAAESLRVSSLRRLGQALGQIRKLFRNREPAVSFLSRGQKRGGFEALKRPRWMIKRLIFLFGARLAK